MDEHHVIDDGARCWLASGAFNRLDLSSISDSEAKLNIETPSLQMPKTAIQVVANRISTAPPGFFFFIEEFIILRSYFSCFCLFVFCLNSCTRASTANLGFGPSQQSISQACCLSILNSIFSVISLAFDLLPYIQFSLGSTGSAIFAPITVATVHRIATTDCQVRLAFCSLATGAKSAAQYQIIRRGTIWSFISAFMNKVVMNSNFLVLSPSHDHGLDQDASSSLPEWMYQVRAGLRDILFSRRVPLERYRRQALLLTSALLRHGGQTWATRSWVGGDCDGGDCDGDGVFSAAFSIHLMDLLICFL